MIKSTNLFSCFLKRKQDLVKNSLRIFTLLAIFFSFTLYSYGQRVYKHWADVSNAWINGDLNKNNSNYTEGEVVPHVFVATDLKQGTSYSVDIIYNYYWSNSNSSGFTNVKAYNTNRSPASLNGTAPTAMPAVDNWPAGTFYTVNATITDATDPVSQPAGGSNLDQRFTITFTPLVDGDAEIYFGLYLAKPGDVTGTKGAASWSGSSLQTTKDDDGGSQSLQIQTDAIHFVCGIGDPDPITGDASVCTGGTLQLSDDTPGGEWSTDDPGIATVDQTGLVTPVSHGTVKITYTVVDENGCGGSVDITITINDPPTIKCPDDLTVCKNADPISLTTGTPTGGIYSGDGITGDQQSGYKFDPSGQTTGDHTITYTITDANTTCTNSCSFTITVADPPTVTCPDDITVCKGATAVTLTGGSPTGGVYSGDGVTGDQQTGFKFDPSTTTVGDHTITYTFTDGNTCSNSCSFTITLADLPTMSCPANSTVCSNDAPLALTGATPAGGTYSGDGVTGDQQSGFTFDPSKVTTGSHTITYTYQNPDTKCSNTCTFTITVNAAPTIYTLSSPPFCSGTSTGSITLSGSQTGVSYQLEKCDNTTVQTAKDGTGTTLTWTGLAAGCYKVVATTKSTPHCSSTTSQITLTGTACAYSFTQGFYGNSTTNNKTCAGTNLNTLLTSLLSTQLNIGGSTKGVYVPIAGSTGTFTPCGGKAGTQNSVDWLIKILPAGSSATALLSGNKSILEQGFNNCTTTGYLTKQTKISNVLLGQTIALSLNIRLTNIGGFGFSLAGVSLDVPSAIMNALPGSALVYINTTQFKQLTGGCTAALGNCTNSYPLNKNVLKAMSTKTVQGLLDLANEALNLGTGTGYTKNSSTFTWTDLNNTIDAINRAFDRGAAFISFTSTASAPCTNTQTNKHDEITTEINTSNASVSVYPNPFSDQVRFVIQSPVSGKATLEVFNMVGQKVRTVFNGQVFAGVSQTVQFNVPYTSRVNMIYILKVNGQQLVGKLISVKQ